MPKYETSKKAEKEVPENIKCNEGEDWLVIYDVEATPEPEKLILFFDNNDKIKKLQRQYWSRKEEDWGDKNTLTGFNDISDRIKATIEAVTDCHNWAEKVNFEKVANPYN